MGSERRVPPRWMKPSEAAEYAGVDREVIRLHVASELLPAYAIGKTQYRLRREDVDHWLETRPWNKYRDGPP